LDTLVILLHVKHQSRHNTHMNDFNDLHKEGTPRANKLYQIDTPTPHFDATRSQLSNNDTMARSDFIL
jgi:hypothetical protein